jgi:radical SAM superfamily enzyme YgiQ (UPF0313 family)
VSIKVSFADLTHTGQLVAANTFPFGISYVAAYADQELGQEIDIEVFKYPEDFSSYLETNSPKFACFSAFSWNVRLGHEFARRIKEFSPETITVFGGPNFPSVSDEQLEFLTKFPAIDCYFEFEGELPFVGFFNTMKSLDFDWEAFKKARTIVPNIRYLANGELFTGPLGPKVKELDMLPSPYLGGLLDKSFDDVLIPMMQTTRGCPYTCTFCWEGGDYFQKTVRFSHDRIKQELHYISERVNTVPDLQITDANFGMFKQDLDTAREIASIKERHPHNWPKSILAATAKNHKERTIEIVEMLGDTMPPTAAVQSTDEQVLSLIRRKNVSRDALVSLAKAVEEQGGQSESEMILGLEGDNREAHFKTVCDMLDADMTFIRMYQFMMLPGTQSSSKDRRKEFGFDTRLRALPRCFGNYTYRGDTFPVAEIEEIAIANNTLSYEDYQACRDFHLTVEIFHNDSIFLDLNHFLSLHGVTRSHFILAIHNIIVNGDGALSQLYSQFREEEKRNLWDDLGELETFVNQSGVIQRYIDGEFGTNELYKYRALAVFRNLEPLHHLVFEVARALLKSEGHFDEAVDQYLTELMEFSLMRKQDVLNTDGASTRTFRFDFARLMESKFTMDPFEAHRPDGIDVEVYHSGQQTQLINGYINQYGIDVIGLGRILIRANMNRLYRSARSLDKQSSVTVEGLVRDSIRGHHHLIE